MWYANSKQAVTGPMYYGGHHKKQWYITNSDYSGSMACGHNIFQQDVYAHITTNVTFNILRNVLVGYVLPNQFPENFTCG
jgi:hypothetical protein